MLTRRGFLGSILALAAAPAIVRAESIMRVRPIGNPIFTGADVQIDGIKVWSEAIWREARDQTYINRFGESVEKMRENDIPPDADGNYFLLIHPDRSADLKAMGMLPPLTKKQREQLPRGQIALLDNLIIRASSP